MLQRYGSSVSDAILTKLVLAFSELRQMADEGLIAYPYSTREVVNIVRHLEVRKYETMACVRAGMLKHFFYLPSFRN